MNDSRTDIVDNNFYDNDFNSTGTLFRNGTSQSVNDTLYAYDYDYDAALDTFYWRQLAPPLVVYGVTYVVGVVGNGLIIFTICRYRRLKTTTNVFLASLASADLLLILICIPVKIARLFSYSWTMGYPLCKLIYYMQSVSSVCSVLTLTIMSLERCYAIIYPMRAMYVCSISKAKRATVITWVTACCLATPTLLVQVHMEVGERVRAYWCVRDFDSPLLWRSYETYMLVLVLLVPACVMAAAYAAICLAIIHMVNARRSITGKGQMMKAESSSVNGLASSHQGPRHLEDKTVRQVVPMLVVVVVLFIVCWGPVLVLNVMQAFRLVPHIDVSTKHVKTLLDLLSYFNSCMNPVVYGFMSKNFRKGFKRALCSLGHSGEHQRSISQSHTLRPNTLRLESRRRGQATTDDTLNLDEEACHM
ncbi:QRFP-like peptide receptor [Procambarus clarkii]|uniref:QRFP-like peptide receptor n=1 Tax=Procambarus clarkii TaxID=6728 RepID=UPI003742B4FC